MYEYCIKCGKKLDTTADDIERGLCLVCKLVNDEFITELIPTNPLEEKLDTIINQLDTIADVLYEMRNRK